MNVIHENRCPNGIGNLTAHFKFMLVALVHLELAGSFRSNPIDDQDKFTSPFLEQEKLSTAEP